MRREYYPLPIIRRSKFMSVGAKYFSKLDTNCGFWQTKLATVSLFLTTFITPFRRLLFKILPTAYRQF